MNNQIIGILLIVMGIALVTWGYNVYDATNVNEMVAFSVEIPLAAWLSMGCGAITILVGFIKINECD
ncbi:DUF3185 family protein [Pseudoalteromonas sp.]|uniref:DUF3185 family protein n=1 Tax=Pseudoalteromonas sp. TaxID=53249 RepID=UPI003566C30D